MIDESDAAFEPDVEEDLEPIEFSDDMLDPAHYESRRDFERGMSYLPVVTLTLIFANILIFCWQVSVGALDNKQAILDAGALDRDLVAKGEYWRLASCMFLHGGVDHLLGNCIALYMLGIACEHAYGRARMLGIYLASGLAGSLLSMLIEPGPMVGASGAIFGLMGCVTSMLILRRKQIHVRDSRIASVIGMWGAYQIVLGFLNPLVANFAHIGGLVGGALIPLVLTPPLLAGPRVEAEETALAPEPRDF